uniref:Uncharacterized protein n=1 Tax=Knipowitschia caucasica TaxID=637954 RepID=A0AAV2LYK0_KNICA
MDSLWMQSLYTAVTEPIHQQPIHFRVQDTRKSRPALKLELVNAGSQLKLHVFYMFVLELGDSQVCLKASVADRCEGHPPCSDGLQQAHSGRIRSRARGELCGHIEASPTPATLQSS